jgi:hypothetical protein
VPCEAATRAGSLARWPWRSAIGYVSTGGGKTWTQTEALIARAGHLADRAGRPDALALVSTATAMAYLLAGRYTESQPHAARAREIPLSERTGLAWEIDLVQYIELSNLANMGELKALCQLTPKYLLDAQRREDLFGEVNMSTSLPNLRWLIVDDPHEARREGVEVMSARRRAPRSLGRPTPGSAAKG